MSFGLEVAKFSSRAILQTEKVKRGVVVALFNSVIRASPKDTGRFQGNWNLGVNSPTLGVDEKSFSIGASLARVQAGVEAFEGDGSIYLSNSLPYAMALEYGWSDQAKEGVVRMNVLRISKLLKKYNNI